MFVDKCAINDPSEMNQTLPEVLTVNYTIETI